MGVMGILWYWLLRVTCIVCCTVVVHCQDLQDAQPRSLDDPTMNILGSLLGFKPILPPDESLTSGKYDQPDIEILPSDLISQEPNQKLCVILKASSVSEYREVEDMQPTFPTVRNKLLEEIISYARAYSGFYDHKCSAEIKFLDLFILAARELRKEYLKVGGGSCSYTFAKGYEWPQLPDTNVPCDLEPKPAILVTPTPVPSDISTQRLGEMVLPATSKSGVSEVKIPDDDIVEIIAEEDEHAPIIGSVRGIPGIQYPNYTDVPITSFSCADKHIPGFYADLEAGCQVFHVCYEHRRESFLCPIGTIFNQPILACDYWYSSNCSLAPNYFEIGVKPEVTPKEDIHAVQELISSIIHETDIGKPEPKGNFLEDIAKFLPVKAKVAEYPDASKTKEDTKKPVVDVEDVASEIFNKLIATATDAASKTRHVIGKLPEPIEPEPLVKPKEGFFKMKPISPAVPLAKVAAKTMKVAAPILAKAKFAAAATIPLAAAKTAIPVAKVTAAKAALPVFAKAKVAAALPAAKVIGAKAAVAPAFMKGKLAAVAVPAAKVAAAKVAVPVVAKAKLAVAVPAAKVTAAKVAVPVVAKAKLAAAVPAAKVTAAKVAVPVAAKAKLAAAVPVAAKAYIPALKAKTIASAVPLAKAKFAVPAVKAKALKAGGIPLVKAKGLAVPLVKSKLAGAAPVVKAKLVKSAVISPLTKKALALGYMKLLKAKKLTLMG